MSASVLLLLLCLLHPCLGRTSSSSSSSFSPPTLTPQRASEFLLRVRRANLMFEELKKGNLERECVEEVCSKEEAREVFENESDTDYFYPRYLACQSQETKPRAQTEVDNIVRSCINEILDQCVPLPCDVTGSAECVSLQADYHCICKDGWKGKNCTQDVDECSDRQNGGCSHKCINVAGSYACQCEQGYMMAMDQHTCEDVDECTQSLGVCGEPARCENTHGSFTCSCLRGFAFDKATRSCQDVDECEQFAPCEDACVNTAGAFRCYCEGRAGFRLGPNLRSCVTTESCVRVNTWMNPTNMHLTPDTHSNPVFFHRYQVPHLQSEVFSFDLLTYDPEGLVLYVERGATDDWFLLALREGRLEMQLSAGGVNAAAKSASTINHGRWTSISVERLRGRVVTRISANDTFAIDVRDDGPAQGGSSSSSKEFKVYVAGLPHGAQPFAPLNTRLDGCMRQWDWLGSERAGGSDVHVRSDATRLCYQSVERGAYFPGTELASFHRQYVPSGNSPGRLPWLLDLEMSFRPVGNTGVLFCLVNYNKEVVLSLSLDEIFRRPGLPLQRLVLGFEDSVALRYQANESRVFCDGKWHSLRLQISREELALQVDGVNLTQADSAIPLLQLSAHRGKLETWLNESVTTYIGGIPETIRLQAVPVSVYFHGCVRDVRLAGEPLDMDAAVNSPMGLSAHSCPTVNTGDDDDDDELE
ncbi:growth arrest-specific protein 6-like [Lampetra planeri]